MPPVVRKRQHATFLAPVRLCSSVVVRVLWVWVWVFGSGCLGLSVGACGCECGCLNVGVWWAVVGARAFRCTSTKCAERSGTEKRRQHSSCAGADKRGKCSMLDGSAL